MKRDYLPQTGIVRASLPRLVLVVLVGGVVGVRVSPSGKGWHQGVAERGLMGRVEDVFVGDASEDVERLLARKNVFGLLLRKRRSIHWQSYLRPRLKDANTRRGRLRTGISGREEVCRRSNVVANIMLNVPGGTPPGICNKHGCVQSGPLSYIREGYIYRPDPSALIIPRYLNGLVQSPSLESQDNKDQDVQGYGRNLVPIPFPLGWHGILGSPS